MVLFSSQCRMIKKNHAYMYSPYISEKCSQFIMICCNFVSMCSSKFAKTRTNALSHTWLLINAIIRMCNIIYIFFSLRISKNGVLHREAKVNYTVFFCTLSMSRTISCRVLIYDCTVYNYKDLN